MSELRFEDVTVRYGADRPPSTASASPCPPARSSAWSASPARASPPWPAPRSASPRSREGRILLDGEPVPATRPQPPAADGLPGPVLLARPADDASARASPRRCPAVAAATERRAEVDAAARAGPPRPGPRRRPPGGAVRRPAPAGRAGPRPRRPARGRDRRRDHLGARRLHPGRRAQPGARAPARARPVDAVHLPQPRGRPLRRDARRGHAPRPDRRAGPDRPGAGRPRARLHPRAARRGTRTTTRSPR